jgi:ethanolamine ammonia-lyase large subunit
MLAYFDTNNHDNQTLKEIYNKKPTAEYRAWAIEQGILTEEDGEICRGKNWGIPQQFVSSKEAWIDLCETTPIMPGLDNSGPRPTSKITRLVRFDQALSRMAIYSELQMDKVGLAGDYRVIRTRATNKDEHLSAPDLGSFISELDMDKLSPENHQVQIVISDGLSAEAIHANTHKLLPVLVEGLKEKGLSCGTPIIAPYGRVKLTEQIAASVNCDLVLFLVGERPGGTAASATSMSCYFNYNIKDDHTRMKACEYSRNESLQYEYQVLSNIYPAGLPPTEAGNVISDTASRILEHQAAGNRLESLLR